MLRRLTISLPALLGFVCVTEDTRVEQRADSNRSGSTLNDVDRCHTDVIVDTLPRSCSSSALGRPVPVQAAPIASATAPRIEPGRPYGVALRAVGDQHEGAIELRTSRSGDYMLYLGTPNLPTEVLNADVQCGRYLTRTLTDAVAGPDCNRELRGVYRLRVVADQAVRIAFGPSPTSRWVRALVLPAQGPADVASVSAGYRHTCAVLNSGELKCFGSNDKGELGQGDTQPRGHHVGEMGDRLSEVDLGPTFLTSAVAAGIERTCAVNDDAGLKCWGSNTVGELGYEDRVDRGSTPGSMGDGLPFVDVDPSRGVETVVAGHRHTCTTLDNGDAKCWGLNNFAQLGIPTRAARGPIPKTMGSRLLALDFGDASVTSLAAGGQHACATLDDGTVRCWGCSRYGEMGHGFVTACPDKGAEGVRRGTVVDLGPDAQASRVGVGIGHSCALLTNGRVKCWGRNHVGQLGLGDTENRGDEPDELGSALDPVDLGPGRIAVELAVGSEHSCVRLDDGAIKCWGYNTYGQLGLGDGRDRGAQPSDMGDNLAAVDLGTGRRAVSVSAGWRHTCAVLDDATLKCWGANDRGQLGQGIGAGARIGDEAGEMGDHLPAIYLGGR
ncbi:MAG: hypothetical protein B7733_19730 [Myxococcales bacterium FL481]|nr:MAG: hypothetical protein B7733_19730 [Myxococcales bacterium FL481]